MRRGYSSAVEPAAFHCQLTVVVCVNLPDVPVTVTVAAPVVAVPFAVSVKMLEEVAGFCQRRRHPVRYSGSGQGHAAGKAVDGVMAIVLVPALPPEQSSRWRDAERL